MTAVRQEVRGQKDDLVMLQCLLVIAKKLEKEWAEMSEKNSKRMCSQRQIKKIQ